MRDEMDSRIWVEHGADFTESLHNFFKQVRLGMKRLNEIQFDAPWRQTSGSGTHG